MRDTRRAGRAIAIVAAATVTGLAPAARAAPTLYVSNFANQGSVSVFDLRSGVPAPVVCDPATICKSNPDPAAIAVDPTATHVYTASDAAPGTVSVFAIGAGGVLAPVGCDPATACRAGNAPEGIAIDPSGTHVYVTNTGSNSVSVFAIGAGGTLSPVTCDPTTNCSAPQPVGVAVDPSGTHLYATNQLSPGSVSVFTIGADGSLTPAPCAPATNCTTGNQPTGVAIDPSGTHLYTSNGGTTDSVSVFAIGAGGTLSPVTCDPSTACKTGSNPVAIAVDPSGSHVYVTNSSGDSVSVFAIGAGGALSQVACDPATACKTGATPDALAIEPNGARLYTTSSNGTRVSPFTIGADGALTPIACDPATTCKTGPAPDFFSAAITPDRGPTAAFTAAGSSFDGSSSQSPDYPIATYAWDFGDGQTQSTTTPATTHAYAQPGSYTATLTVTDTAGCSAGRVFTGQTAYCNGSGKARVSHAVAIAGPAVTAGRISNLRIRPSTLVAAARGRTVIAAQAKKKRRKTGALVSYTDTQAATTTFTVQGTRSGRRNGARCAKPTKRNRKRRRCTRFVSVGSFTHADAAGANRFRFTGRIRGHKLRPGSYRLRAVPKNAGGTGKATFRRFRVKK